MEQPASGHPRRLTSEGHHDTKDSSRPISKSRSNPLESKHKGKSGSSKGNAGDKRPGHSRQKADGGAQDEKGEPSREKVESASKALAPKEDKREKHGPSREKVEIKTSPPSDKEERRGHSRDKIDTSKGQSKSPSSPRVTLRSKSRPKSERMPTSPVNKPEATLSPTRAASPSKATSPSKARPKSERLSPGVVRSDSGSHESPRLAAKKDRAGSSPELGRKEARAKDERKDERRREEKIVSPKAEAGAGKAAPPSRSGNNRRAPSLADQQRQWTLNRSKPIRMALAEDTYMNPVFLSQKALYVSLGDSLPSPQHKPHREVFTVWMLDGVYHKFPYRPDMTLKELGEKISRKVFADTMSNEWVLLDGESSKAPLGPDTKLSALPSRAVRWIPELATTSNVRLQSGLEQLEYRRLVKKQLRISPHPPLICGHARELPKDIQKLLDRAGIDLEQAEKFFATTCCLIRWVTRRPIFMDEASLNAMREASLQKDEWGKKTPEQLVPSLKPAAKIIRKFSEAELALVKTRFKFDRGKEGQGGFGAVFRAIDLYKDNVPVAVKKMEATPSNKREIQFLDGLKHPNVVEFQWAFDMGGELWLGMEFVEGGLLSELLETGLSEAAMAFICRGVAAALAFLHAKGLTHRDLKPQNVMLTNKPRAKLIDFGLCTHVDIARPTTMCGSPAFMSPEMIAGIGHGTATDIWSLGMIAVEMANEGHSDGLSEMNWMFQVSTGGLEPPLPSDKGFSPGFHDFLAQTLVKSPAKRATASQLLSEKFLSETAEPAELVKLLGVSKKERERQVETARARFAAAAAKAEAEAAAVPADKAAVDALFEVLMKEMGLPASARNFSLEKKQLLLQQSRH